MTQKNTLLSKYGREGDDKKILVKRIPILIVVEGKTEEEYFKKCKEKYGLQEVTVTNNGTHTSPLQIVQALEQKKTTLNDRTKSVAVFFAVFDHCKKDPNTGKDVYNEAIELCKKNKFTPITSKPSFEFWLILHFTETDGEMSAKEAEQKLNTYYKSQLKKEYKKGSSDTFENTVRYLPKAIEHAEKTWKKERERACSKEKSRQKEKSSYTNVHELIQKLNL